MRALVIAVGLVLMACGGGSELDGAELLLDETGGAAGATVGATGGDALDAATGGAEETGGNATGGAVPATGGTATGGIQTGGTATGGSVEPVCEAGRQVACPCVGGEDGVQACRDDGSGWTLCECSEIGTGGSGGAVTDQVCAPGARASCCRDEGGQMVDCDYGDVNCDGGPTTRICWDDGSQWSICMCLTSR